MQNLASQATKIDHFIILVRADPIICGHSTEARNLAEAAITSGVQNVHIVSYPLDVLQSSRLPLKPIESISPYSLGISIDRPDPVGDYKVLDGKITLGMSGHIVDLISTLKGNIVVMGLYLVPHGFMVMQAVQSFQYSGTKASVFTIGEAVGSDITNVVGNALKAGKLGAAQVVLSNFLAHDLPVAVSQFTKDLIVEAGREVDERIGSNFAKSLEEKVKISYPAIDAEHYISIENRPEYYEPILENRELTKDGYVMFLSRIAPAKGVDDLLDAWEQCKFREEKQLIICGNGPAKEDVQLRASDLGNVQVLDDVSDEEKGALLYGCSAYCLPSKPKTEFVETFGIAVAEKMLAGGLGPVITTRTGGIPEATGGHCLEHEAGNVDDLVAQLNKARAMSDEERVELSSKARTFAKQFDRTQILSWLMKMASKDF